jgi:hypothetical protein
VDEAVTADDQIGFRDGIGDNISVSEFDTVGAIETVVSADEVGYDIDADVLTGTSPITWRIQLKSPQGASTTRSKFNSRIKRGSSRLSASVEANSDPRPDTDSPERHWLVE